MTNEIDFAGVLYFAEALLTNQVTLLFIHFSHVLQLVITDAYKTESPI